MVYFVIRCSVVGGKINIMYRLVIGKWWFVEYGRVVGIDGW